MTIFAKICGLTNRESVEIVDECRAAYAGFIFYPKSPRYITPEKAASITGGISKSVIKVAVVVNPSDEVLQDILDKFTPDYLQLHGNESIKRVDEIQLKFGLPIIKAFQVSSAKDVKNAMKYLDVANMFLFDAKPPKGSELPGGNGVPFDWRILSGAQFEIPVFISGGININNVSQAVGKTGIKMIDVSSGVESSPGKKDIIKIRQLMAKIAEIES